MKREEFIQNVTVTAAVIGGAAVFTAMFAMNLAIQTCPNVAMKHVWVIGVTAFVIVTCGMISWVIRRLLPEAVMQTKMAKSTKNPYSFTAIAKRRIYRRLTTARQKRVQMQPSRTISAKMYDLPLG